MMIDDEARAARPSLNTDRFFYDAASMIPSAPECSSAKQDVDASCNNSILVRKEKVVFDQQVNSRAKYA